MDEFRENPENPGSVVQVLLGQVDFFVPSVKKKSVIFRSHPVTTYGLYIRLVYAHNVSMRQEMFFIKKSMFLDFPLRFEGVQP